MTKSNDSIDELYLDVISLSIRNGINEGTLNLLDWKLVLDDNALLENSDQILELLGAIEDGVTESYIDGIGWTLLHETNESK